MRCPICKSNLVLNYKTIDGPIMKLHGPIMKLYYHCYNCDIDPIFTYEDGEIIEIGFEIEDEE